MGVPKGEKKQLIKFVPSGNFPRDRKIKFSTALLAWQELGGQGAPGLPFWKRMGPNC